MKKSFLRCLFQNTKNTLYSLSESVFFCLASIFHGKKTSLDSRDANKVGTRSFVSFILGRLNTQMVNPPDSKTEHSSCLFSLPITWRILTSFALVLLMQKFSCNNKLRQIKLFPFSRKRSHCADN